MNLEELSKQVAIPLITSLIIAVSTVLYNAGTQKVLLEQNIVATAELSKVVTDLRLQMAVGQEKYVSRQELEQRLAAIAQSLPRSSR